MVIIMGRSFKTASSTAASSTEYRRTRNWLIYSSMMTPFLPRRQRGQEADPSRDAEVRPGHQKGKHAADGCDGDVGHDLSGSECTGLLTSPTAPTDIRLTILQFAPIVLLSAVHHLTRLLDRRPELF